MTINALSIDLEEWYHAETLRLSGLAFERESQVVAATTPILDLLKRYNVHATFFTVGEVAQAHPKLIERLLADGHELAFHGWTHLPLWSLTPETFAAEIEQFFAWQQATFPTAEILGYRAPTFSLDSRTAWAVQTLIEAGFCYDASIFPAKTPLYGVEGAPRQPYPIRADNLHGNPDSPLLEIPMSVAALGSFRLGFTGGLYLRALPWSVVRGLILRHNAAGNPVVIYVHPWEAHAPTPRLPLRYQDRLILYTGIPMLKKLERLLATFRFDTMRRVFLP